MGDQHEINAASRKGQGRIVHLVYTLLQAAVHQNALAAYLQAVAAAGDALIGTVKTELHTRDLLQIFDATIVARSSKKYNGKAHSARRSRL